MGSASFDSIQDGSIAALTPLQLWIRPRQSMVYQYSRIESQLRVGDGPRNRTWIFHLATSSLNVARGLWVLFTQFCNTFLCEPRPNPCHISEVLGDGCRDRAGREYTSSLALRLRVSRRHLYGKTVTVRRTTITFSIWDLGGTRSRVCDHFACTDCLPRAFPTAPCNISRTTAPIHARVWMPIDDVTCPVFCHDYPGQRKFVNMLPLVCNDAIAILFMFGLTRKSTLHSIKELYWQVRGFNKVGLIGLRQMPTSDMISCRRAFLS